MICKNCGDDMELTFAMYPTEGIIGSYGTYHYKCQRCNRSEMQSGMSGKVYFKGDKEIKCPRCQEKTAVQPPCNRCGLTFV